VSGELHALDALPLGKNPDISWTGGYGGPTTGLDVVEKRRISCLCPEPKAGRPAGR
jgi:hypothetical protein